MSTTGISQANAVKLLIESARQRRFFVLAVEQLALALTLVCAGAILLLLLGTQILAWYWLVLLAAVGIGIGAYRIYSRRAGHYTVAQFLDRRLNLHDSLSTAWFLLSRPEGADQPSARYQLEYAGRIAGGVDPVSAFPLTGRRVWAIAGGVAAVAFGLFAVRYLVTNSLNLRQGLVPIHLAEVFERVGKSLGAHPHSAPNPDGGNRRNPAVPQNNESAKTASQDRPNAEELKAGKSEAVSPPQVPTASSEPPQNSNRAEEGKSENQEGSSSAGQRKPGEKGQPRDSQQAGSQQGPNSQQQPGADQQNAAKQEASQQQNSVGTMDRLKEAISSLMAKMRPSSAAQKSQQQSDRSSESQQAGEQAAGDKNKSGDAQKDGSDQQSSEQKSADAQAQGQTTEKAQASQGHSADKSADKSNSDAHSGVGRQDGDKSISEKDQLKAMGKLAEIIGKRSAELTGDVMIENPSGKQQLKTGYSQRMGNHADLGGEINRDEISPANQQYVRQYMEEVRKPAK